MPRLPALPAQPQRQSLHRPPRSLASPASSRAGLAAVALGTELARNVRPSDCLGDGRRRSSQGHDELAAEAGLRADVEGAVDRRAPGADVLESLAGTVALLVEAASVVTHSHDALAVALADHDLRPPRAGVLADVREP